MSKNDTKIKQLMAVVEKQKTSMGTRPKLSFETNGLFLKPDGSRLNLNTVGDGETLVVLLGSLLQKEEFTSRAAKMLGVKDTLFMWGGYSVADWAGDFLQVIRVLTWRKKKVEFDKVNKKLSKLISADAKTEMELEEIEKLLG